MKNYLILLGMAFCMTQGHAQNLNGSDAKKALDEFRRSVHSDLDNFRERCMAQFIEFVRNPWKEFEETKPVPIPEEEPVPPIVIPEEEKDKPIEDKPVVIDDVVTPPPPVAPRPEPVEPIEEVPTVDEHYVTFTFFGIKARVRFNLANKVTINGADHIAIANALSRYTQEAFDNMLIDCLSLREEYHLCDWAYLQMLKSLSDKIHGRGTNEAALLLGFLYMQSGYQMRMGFNADKLYVLVGSNHRILEFGGYDVGGKMYYGVEDLPSNMYICEAAYPNEKLMSLTIAESPILPIDESPKKVVTSKQYSNMEIEVSANKNLMAFYNTYPTSMIGENHMTRWALYANTPLDPFMKDQIYPILNRELTSLSKYEAASRLLNLLQTGLEYEYDDKVWGHDRAFFSEESLFYPYCDCEDRAILYTRLVRDLLDLDCILVHYPGHLASAVCFPTGDVKGDYIQLGGKKYIIADPTYIGAPIGKTMPDMDNKTASVILLE